uniref:Lig_chan-Glu_bd domain-containing protein n=1 Tax=Angiostrongylus cantonensis TaxID=6313 RepID=A0A0K0DHW7_ANGCA
LSISYYVEKTTKQSSIHLPRTGASTLDINAMARLRASVGVSNIRAMKNEKESSDFPERTCYQVAPFVMTKRECLEQNNRTECQGNNKYEGYCIDLLKLLADRIEGFNFEVYLVDKTGSRLPDGNWDGMIGDLLNGRADVAVASLTINQAMGYLVYFCRLDKLSDILR